ncbi:hypothetical protein DSO57_1008613 [Entomophthora muscae]|uniref:Uncharacterized protein n=1 Tax=Entomophthora muscae TaxID=34485 RepID=A0ACC2RY27_9FUNG|nr:hypothetical protein DSO57_1008613 [Entomophthora muscae]
MSDSSAWTEYEVYYNQLGEEGKRWWKKYPCEYRQFLVSGSRLPSTGSECFMTTTEASSVVQTDISLPLRPIGPPYSDDSSELSLRSLVLGRGSTPRVLLGPDLMCSPQDLLMQADLILKVPPSSLH